MSRGLGKLQREVLRIVDEGGRRPDAETVTSLTRQIHGEQFTDTQRRSVARAVSTLAERGLVETYRSAERFRPAHGPARVVHADYVAGFSPEPTTARGRMLKAAGLEGTSKRRTEYRVPILETFVALPARSEAFPAAIEQDRRLSGLAHG